MSPAQREEPDGFLGGGFPRRVSIPPRTAAGLIAATMLAVSHALRARSELLIGRSTRYSPLWAMHPQEPTNFPERNCILLSSHLPSTSADFETMILRRVLSQQSRTVARSTRLTVIRLRNERF
jgi:hypothetical protein